MRLEDTLRRLRHDPFWWWRTPAVPLLLLSLAVWATFGRSLRNELVFDELTTIKNNRAIGSLKNLPLLFSKQYFRAFDEYSYRPVVTLSYFFDGIFAGKRPGLYHFHNVLLHHANVLLAFALFSLLGVSRWRAFLIALLFAIHPLHAEAVIFPGFREDLQLTLGLLVMSCCLAADRRDPAGPWLVWAPGALAFALFAKEGALLMPLAWWAADLIYNRTSGRPIALRHRHLLLGLVLGGYLLIRFAVMANPEAATPAAAADPFERLVLSPAWSLPQRLLTVPYLFAYTLWRFLWPLPLCIIPDLEPLTTAGPAFFLSVVACAAFVGLWLVLARREPWLWLAGLWAGAAFLPVSNIYEIANLWAERFCYSMGVGLAAVAVAAAGAFWRWATARFEERRRLSLAIGAWILVGFLFWAAAICDMGRILQCRTSLSLWRQTVYCVPTNGMALGTLAKYELDAGNHDRVERLAPALERYDPWTFRANFVLGENAFRQGKYEPAIAYYEKAKSELSAGAGLATSVTVGLATAYFQLGRRDRAAAVLRDALRQDPANRRLKAAFEQFAPLPAEALPTSGPAVRPEK